MSASQLAVQVTLTEACVIGHPRRLQVTLTNTGEGPVAPGWVKVSGNGEWYGSVVDLTSEDHELQSGEALDVEVTQEPRWGATIRGVVPKMVVTHSAVTAPGADGTMQPAEFEVAIPLFGYVAGLKCSHPALFAGGRRPQFGILGLMGSGKTTFVNTLSTVFSNAHGFTRSFATGSGATTHTRDLNSLVLENFTVTDSYGLERGRWPAAHLQLFLDGVIPSKTSMERVASLTPAEIAKLRTTAWKRRLDAVIFCVPATLFTLDVGGQEVVAALEAFEAIRHASPVIALTKADEADERVKAEDFDLQGEWMDALRDKAAAMFHIDARRVCPVVSYRHEAQRSERLDQAVMTLVETALRCADDAAEQREALGNAFPMEREAWTMSGWTWHQLLAAAQ